MTEKKSLVEEALLQMRNLEQVVAENAKGILASTMKEEISELVKESLKNEAEDESMGVEMDDESEDDLDMDMNMDSDDENMDDIEMDFDMDSDDDESEDELEMDFDMDSDDTLPIDLTNASDDEILKVFKSMSDEDGIIVKQDGDQITLSDEDEDVEYIIQTESYMENEPMQEMDGEEELSDEDLDSMMADIFGEEMNIYEQPDDYGDDNEDGVVDEDEVVYEIEMDDYMDDDSDDKSMNDYSGDESMFEGKMTIKPVMGKLTKSSLTNKVKKMETKEGSMMSKPVVGKGVKTGSAKFEYKEGRKMETKESAIEPKGMAKGVGMNLKPKKFEYTEAEMKDKYGSKKHEYRRKDVDGVEKKAGEKDGHYKDYEKEETKEAARTLGNGTRNYAERKGLPKMKVIPNQALAEEVERLREKNEEYRKALNIFRDKLNEVAVFNSNLAYATRLFTEHTTTKQEKINILRRFDDVESLKESKTLYSSIKGELNTTNSTQSVVTESIEKIGKSPASGSSQNLIESKTYENPQFLRMKDIMQKIQK
jgi:hypothetical protein